MLRPTWGAAWILTNTIMVLLLTSDGDYSTDLIQDWLCYFKHPYIQITTAQIFEQGFDMSVSPDSSHLFIGGLSVPVVKIGSILYRKFGFFRNTNTYKALLESHQVDEPRLAHLNAEFNKIREAFLSEFEECEWLPKPMYCNPNKYKVLKIAVRCGLTIPETRIVNHKKDLTADGSWITKSIYNPVIANWGNENKSMMYTVPIKSDDNDSIPDSFFPSLIQRRIDKDYEIRVFYLDGLFFPMGIFSQDDSQTVEDFRDYNWNNPNRFVPIKLPHHLISCLDNLMNRLHLNTGSIDLIKDKSGNYVFLEVNPTGQFGMIDFPCNYGIHKKMAEWLIKHDLRYGQN